MSSFGRGRGIEEKGLTDASTSQSQMRSFRNRELNFLPLLQSLGRTQVRSVFPLSHSFSSLSPPHFLPLLTYHTTESPPSHLLTLSLSLLELIRTSSLPVSGLNYGSRARDGGPANDDGLDVLPPFYSVSPIASLLYSGSQKLSSASSAPTLTLSSRLSALEGRDGERFGRADFALRSLPHQTRTSRPFAFEDRVVYHSLTLTLRFGFALRYLNFI